ncbi:MULTISPECIES: type II toxin-antitoxin system VapC family toxin [unclassified Frankia]|uniref:type II toxin-antitoxin system VapC family toxin n=1 Tax=unclassified Frankia TaxID=2632575 RepID=UPI002AD2A1BF|nr:MULTISPECIES: type II toxin-antitoxin system VapC family toxin [unclassified Frankia]
MIYLDSSAIVKLVRQESETDALRAWLAANPMPLTASALARTEATRALIRTEPAALPVLRAVFAVLHQKPITDAVLDAAATLPDAMLRSLDAIHLATAEELAPVLTWFVAYDKRLVQAARSRGLPVASPT